MQMYDHDRNENHTKRSWYSQKILSKILNALDDGQTVLAADKTFFWQSLQKSGFSKHFTAIVKSLGCQKKDKSKITVMYQGL